MILFQRIFFLNIAKSSLLELILQVTFVSKTESAEDDNLMSG